MDLYRFDPSEHKEVTALWHQRFGMGPFAVIRQWTDRKGYRHCNVKNIHTGKVFKRWGPPENWGVLDPFLTAAYNAVEQKDDPPKG